jgi:AcrR family transcriptional regulator
MGIEERKEREKNRRRESILQAARKAYLEDGWRSTTMEKIAEKAELSRATLYLYYKTKDHIFIDAIVSFLKELSVMLGEVYRRREQLKEDLLKETWRAFVDFYHMDPEMFSISLLFIQREMLPVLPEELRDSLDKAGRQNHSGICKIMEYGIQNNLFIRCNPITLTEAVWSTFLGIVHIENMKKAMSRKSHLDVTLRLAFEILSKGILQSPDRVSKKKAIH